VDTWDVCQVSVGLNPWNIEMAFGSERMTSVTHLNGPVSG
jgi:hypothetical protein